MLLLCIYVFILNFDTGDELEAARLAESETWTSQELDRSTPDLLHAGPDVLSHGHPGEKRISWEEEEEGEKWDVKTEGEFLKAFF